jgi:hypothetical protein
MAAPGPRWTETDLEKLRSFAGKYPTAAIAAELGRGRSSVAVKAHRLCISLRVNDDRLKVREGGQLPVHLHRT